MIELIGTWLISYDSGFDVLRYLTVRTIGGTLTALMVSIDSTNGIDPPRSNFNKIFIKNPVFSVH